jgi:Sulfotransferase family
MSALSPMPIVVGAPRSGTTLLRFMLDAHPSMAIPPETGFLAAPALFDCDLSTVAGFHSVVTGFPPEAPTWDDFGLDADDLRDELRALSPFTPSAGFRTFYRMYARKHRKPRYGDKTPIYCEHLAVVERFLPEARFVHIIRDGRDTSLSLRRTWFTPAQDMWSLARYWQRMVLAGRRAGRRAAAYLEISYEELVLSAPRVVSRVCEFIDLTFDPAMMRYWERVPDRLREHRGRVAVDGRVLVTREQRLEQQRLTTRPPQPDRIFRWRTEMTASERQEFARAAGDTLSEFGYEV